MSLLHLHDKNNPTQLKLVASDDISTVSSMPDGGSCIVQKCGVTAYVTESTEQIAEIAEGQNDGT